MKDIQKIKEFFSKSIEEATFKIGDKVTYLGYPGEIVGVRTDTSGRTYYNVSYNKGTGRRIAQAIYNKSGEIKLAEAITTAYEGKEETAVDMAKKQLDALGVKYEMSKTDKVRPFKTIIRPINKSDSFYREFNRIIFDFNLGSAVVNEYDGFKSSKEFINIKLKRYPKTVAKINQLIDMIGESNFTMEMAEWIWDFFNNAHFERPINESKSTEGIKVGDVLNLKDGETWKVVKLTSNGGVLAAPFGKTKDSYISIAIEFPAHILKNEVVSLNETKEKNKQYYKNVALLDKKGLAKKQFSDEDIQMAKKMLSQGQFKLNEAKSEEYMISKSGSKFNPYYVLEKPDGSKQIDMMFTSPEEAKKYAAKKNLKISSKPGYNMNEAKSEDPVDTITMDIPLFLRMLEYSREDASQDMDLHDVTEKANKLGKERGILSMEDYDEIVGAAEEIKEGMTAPEWNSMSKEDKIEILQKNFPKLSLKFADWKWEDLTPMIKNKLTGKVVKEGMGNEIGDKVYFKGDIGEKYPSSQGYYGIIEDTTPARNYNMMATYDVVVYDKNDNEIRTITTDFTNLTTKKVNEGELTEAKSFTLDSESASDSDKITDFLTKNNIDFKKVGSKITVMLDRDTPKASVILSKLNTLAKFDELNEASDYFKRRKAMDDYAVNKQDKPKKQTDPPLSGKTDYMKRREKELAEAILAKLKK